MVKEIVHQSVLSDKIIKFLNPGSKKSLLIDSTLGEGGHTEFFLSRFPRLKVIGIETDEEIIKVAEKRLAKYKARFSSVNLWFTDFYSNYEKYSKIRPDYIFFDLGISNFHYKSSKRGFSFNIDEDLDMRLSTDLAVSAKDIVNSYSEGEISSIFFKYGEERFSRRIAKKIIEYRAGKKINTTFQLVEIIKSVVPSYQSRIHPATRCFQALRIAVNKELENVENAIKSAFKVLKIGGRIAVISFHSLEDRIVKRFFKIMNKSCTCPPEWPICKCKGQKKLEILTKKPIVPDRSEIDKNKASRSSKLRVAEKLIEDED
jgi:16S rRNA (cytosine1402-N4)-methyltransferase